MAKYCNTNVIDAALNYIVARSTRIVVLNTLPANLAACTAATYICRATLTTSTGSNFQLANGDVSGRKLTISQQSTLAVNTTGVANYVCLYGTAAGNSGLWYYTTCAAATVQSTADKVTIPAWDIEISDAT